MGFACRCGEVFCGNGQKCDDMCKPIMATGVCRAFSFADVVGSGKNDVADFRKVASEGAVERVT